MFTYRDVHFDGKSRGKFHFDEIPQFLKMIELRSNQLKLLQVIYNEIGAKFE